MQKFTKLTDEMLVAAYAEGNNEAFDALLKRHEIRIFNYIFNIVKNKDVADDIFQETFVKAITTIKQGRYTDSGKFSAWITRQAVRWTRASPSGVRQTSLPRPADSR